MKTRPVHCAAVDLGATSGRVVVGTWAGGRLELREIHRFPNRFRRLAGHDYWDVPSLWAEAAAGLVKAQAEFPLASVGADSWGVDHVLTDRRGRPVFPVHCYRDGRTAAGSARLSRAGLARIYALTGIPNYPYNTSLQLEETLGRFPALARVAERCLFIPDYFNFLLSGRMENEASISSHSQMLSAGRLEWSPEALRRFGVPRRWFSGPRRSPARLGPVTGLPELSGALAMLVPGHDTACAFTAMPTAPEGGDLYLSTGTWSLLGFESPRALLTPEALALRISNERMGDGRFRPLRSCLGLWLLERLFDDLGARPANQRDWRDLFAAARRSPAPRAWLDVNDPALFNPRSMRAAIDRALRRRGARPPSHAGGYVRLICESLGRGHAAAARSFARIAGRAFARILVVGGGARNPLLCQATADDAGLPVEAYPLEGAALGNIGAQLIGLGEIADLAAFRAVLARQFAATAYPPQ